MHLFPKYLADLKSVVHSDLVNEHYAEGVVHFCSTTDTGTSSEYISITAGLIYHIKGKVALESKSQNLVICQAVQLNLASFPGCLGPGNEANLNHDSLYGHIGLSNPVELYFTRQSGYMGTSELKEVPGQSSSGPYESCVVFAGTGLQENALKLWLEDCRGEVRYTSSPFSQEL